MSISHFIALRYLKSSQENRYFSWITILSTAGLAIGVAALIVVLSVINGFESELRNRFLHANAHIMAYRYPAGMNNPEKWAEMIQNDFKKDVMGISPFIHYETMMKRGSFMHGVLVRGITPAQRERVQSLKKLVNPAGSLNLLQKEMDDAEKGLQPPEIPSLIVGSGLLSIINANVGEVVYLVSPSESKNTQLFPFRISGIYNSGLKHYDNRLVAMSLAAAKKLFKMGNVVTGLEIGLYRPEESVEVSERMKEKYNLTFREWQSFNRPLFEAMKKERVVISLIVAMVVIVAAFNILTTIFVSVSQKQRDISILKSLGASNRQIVKLFVNQGLYIGVLGSLIGVILALIISLALEKYQFIDLPDPYFLKNLPVDYNPLVYIYISFSAILLCLLAGLYPAFIASKVTPTDGFRGTGDAI
ncbi:MAG: FtsX-like permease family protein [Oligoflexales bacterium]|nr:FtsX-like permease family protein [Oligoflexales bacterium]